MSYRSPKLIGEALQQFLDRFPQKTRLKQGLVLSVWEEVAGPQIAKEATNLHFEGNKLVMSVKNQIWRHEIHMNRFRIAKRLNDRVQAQVVSEIIVRS